MRFNVLNHPVCLAMLMVSMSFSMAPAQDDASATDSKKPAKTKADEDKKADDKEESKPGLLDKLTKELFKELEQEPAEKKQAPQEDKLDRAAKGMRSAGDKLNQSETGDDTRKIQEQVIRDLDDLIKQLQQPPPNGGGGGGGGGANSKSGRMQQLQKGGTGQAQAGQGQQSQGQASKAGMSGKSGGKEREKAEGSEERTDAERKAAEEAARNRKLELDVWGHLPPHLREQLLNTYGERMLPKYEQLVKQFYEALSEQSDSNNRK